MDTEDLLRIEDMAVAVDSRPILHDINLEIKQGEIHVLFGPNGSGKTSLLMAIMGVRRYHVTKGRIWYQGRDITHLPADERARQGIGMIYQRPPTVRGVSLSQLANLCVHDHDNNAKHITTLAKDLHCEALLSRDVNAGFSGGEIKKSELLQVLAQRPTLTLIDEPDAGVDLDSIGLVGEMLNRVLKEPTAQGRPPAGLLITHTGHILNYIQADLGHVLYEGTLIGEGEIERLFDEIKKHGYGKCPICRTNIPANNLT